MFLRPLRSEIYSCHVYDAVNYGFRWKLFEVRKFSIFWNFQVDQKMCKSVFFVKNGKNRKIWKYRVLYFKLTEILRWVEWCGLHCRPTQKNFEFSVLGWKWGMRVKYVVFWYVLSDSDPTTSTRQRWRVNAAGGACDVLIFSLFPATMTVFGQKSCDFCVFFVFLATKVVKKVFFGVAT